MFDYLPKVYENNYMEKLSYNMVSLPSTPLSPDQLLSGEYDDEIKKRMEETVKIEAPITQSLLYKRVILSFGLEKIGSRLIVVFDRAAASLEFEKTKNYNGEFIFHYGDESFFRPSPDSSVRYSYQIAASEAANALLFIIDSSEKSSWLKKDLLDAFSEIMEWQRKGAKVVELYNNALLDPRIKRAKNGRILK